MNKSLVNLLIFFRCRLALVILYLFKRIDHVLCSMSVGNEGTNNSTFSEQQGEEINLTQKVSVAGSDSIRTRGYEFESLTLKLEFAFLTLSRWRSLSYRKHSIDLLCKLIEWFLYDRDLRHERVKVVVATMCLYRCRLQKVAYNLQ